MCFLSLWMLSDGFNLLVSLSQLPQCGHLHSKNQAHFCLNFQTSMKHNLEGDSKVVCTVAAISSSLQYCRRLLPCWLHERHLKVLPTPPMSSPHSAQAKQALSGLALQEASTQSSGEVSRQDLALNLTLRRVADRGEQNTNYVFHVMLKPTSPSSIPIHHKQAAIRF